MEWEVVETWPENPESQKGQRITLWVLEGLAEALTLQAGNGKLVKGFLLLFREIIPLEMTVRQGDWAERGKSGEGAPWWGKEAVWLPKDQQTIQVLHIRQSENPARDNDRILS